MKPEAQRIAIARLCGFKDITCGPFGQCYSGEEAIPDYLRDLSAMHAAEETLKDIDAVAGIDQPCYCEMLAHILGARWDGKNGYDMWLITHATASQRAEAFLRTADKWIDDCGHCGGSGVLAEPNKWGEPCNERQCDHCEGTGSLAARPTP